MGKLMKYELFRRSKLLITILIVLFFMECAAVYGLYRGDSWLILFFIMLIGMAFAAFIIPLIDAVVNYYSDFKNTHGYMLFLTPQSGYQIIGSKALFALFELLAAVGLVAGFYVVNLNLAGAFGYTEAVDWIRMVFGMIPQSLGTSTGGIVTLGAASLILQYFNTIMLAITAVTVAKTLLSQKSFNWLIALLLYFALALVVETVNGLVLTSFGFVKDMIEFTREANSVTLELGDKIKLDIIKYMVITMGLYVVWIGAAFTGSSMLLNKRVDL